MPPGSDDRGRGFTLIEILIVIAVIGIIASMMIPNFMQAMQKAKQRRTMAEMHHVGKAMMSWITDQVAAAAAGAGTTFDINSYGSSVSVAALDALLVPNYMQEIPPEDGWGHPFEYYLKTGNVLAANVMAIRSPGRDGTFSGPTYTAGFFGPTDFDQDIVWADGYFVRWPEGGGSAP